MSNENLKLMDAMVRKLEMFTLEFRATFSEALDDKAGFLFTVMVDHDSGKGQYLGTTTNVHPNSMGTLLDELKENIKEPNMQKIRQPINE